MENQVVPKTVVSELLGGLGNQMFQYAIGRSLAEKYGAEFYLCRERFTEYKVRAFDLHRYQIVESFADERILKNFNLHGRFKAKSRVQRAVEKIFPGKPKAGWVEIHEKENFVFDPSVMTPAYEHVYLTGYWQSPFYFESIGEKIRRELQLKHPATGKNREFLDLLGKKLAVSVHVRRGDYVTNQSAANFHGSCSLDYYQASAKTMLETVKPDVFVVFSDDIPWCRENLKLPAEALYVEHNSQDEGYEDIRLMEHCRGHIIANSTFSWWGAWLAGDRSKLVIGPKQWTNHNPTEKTDLFPKHWLMK